MALTHYIQRWAGGFADGNAGKPVDAQFLNAVETALLGLLGADPTDGQVHVYDNALGRFKTALLTNAHIDPAAAIAKSKLGALNITDADIAAGASISQSKLNLQPGGLGKPVAWGKNTGAPATANGTFATGLDVLSSALSFAADGTSTYLVTVVASYATCTLAGGAAGLLLNLDGAQSSYLALGHIEANGHFVPFSGGAPITPAAGTHTVNGRLINAGAGGTVTVQNPVIQIFQLP